MVVGKDYTKYLARKCAGEMGYSERLVGEVLRLALICIRGIIRDGEGGRIKLVELGTLGPSNRYEKNRYLYGVELWKVGIMFKKGCWLYVPPRWGSVGREGILEGKEAKFEGMMYRFKIEFKRHSI